MSIGLIGKKIGMTREFFDSGISVPVTVLFIEKGRIIDVITKDKRGYDAYQLYLKEKEKRDSDTTLNLGEKIHKSLKEDATRFQTNMKKTTIKWRPEYNTYMSDYDYNLQLLIDARKANE